MFYSIYYKLVFSTVLFLLWQVYGTSLFAQKIKPQKKYTSFDYYDMTLTYSAKNDKINAGKCLLNVTPYYFLFERNATPKTIDSLLSRLMLTEDTRKRYRLIFMQVYNSPKTKAYKNFKSMFDEDQMIRNELSDCVDSLKYAELSRLMYSSDTLHFNYLHKYIDKYGTPIKAILHWIPRLNKTVLLYTFQLGTLCNIF